MSDDGDEGMDREAFAATLADRFTAEFDVDNETATEAADRAAAFREDHDGDLTTETVVEAVRDAATVYDTFLDRYDCAVGDLAASVEGCTDSRAYRLAGFGDLAADPEQGA